MHPYCTLMHTYQDGEARKDSKTNLDNNQPGKCYIRKSPSK